MKPFRVLAYLLFGALFLPLVFVQAQERKSKRAADLIADAEKQFWKPGTVEERRKAVDEIVALSDRLSSMVQILASRGLEDEDDEVRAKSLKALALVGPSSYKWSEYPLLTSIKILEKDKSPENRIGAAMVLVNIFWGGSNPKQADKGISALIRALREDEDTVVRRRICSGLRFIGPLAKDAAPILLEIIKDNRDVYTQELACDALGDVVCAESKKIVPALLEIYSKENDESWKVKGTILAVLGKIGDQQVVIPTLIKALQDPKKIQFRTGAARGVEYLGPKAKIAVPALIAALDVSCYSEKSHPGKADSVLCAVLDALGSIGPDASAAVPAIRRIAEATRPPGSTAAERALSSITRK
jgi:HEAT repeat protein